VEQLQKIHDRVKHDHPGVKMTRIEKPGGEEAAILYMPGFFKDLNAAMTKELRTLGPESIDRHSHMRQGSGINHKSLRWNANITDGKSSSPAGLFAEQKKMAAAMKKAGEPVRLPQLASSQVPFSDMPAHAAARSRISRMGVEAFGEASQLGDLHAEVNFYFQETPGSPSGIGFHGDGERKLVIGANVGDGSRRIQWLRFQHSQVLDTIDAKTGEPVRVIYEMTLAPGDLYMMSEGAAGGDWLTNKKGVTIRHRASGPGSDLFAKTKLKTSDGAVPSETGDGTPLGKFVKVDCGGGGGTGDGAAAPQQASTARTLPPSKRQRVAE
jgi:hypothetical protein